MSLRNKFLTVRETCILASLSRLPGSNSPRDVEASDHLIIDLKYKGLLATVTSGLPLPRYGNDPNSMWAEMAKRVATDADAPPFSNGGSAPRYDLWPVLTLKPGTEDPIDPSYLVRLSLIPGSGCATKVIDQQFLKAFATVFTDIAQRVRKPNYSFTGTVDHGRINYYQFKLEWTGKKVAMSVWTQNRIDQPALDILNSARAQLLKNTKPRDLILCIGSSGSLIYNTLNRPDDDVKDRRNAWQIPLSEAQDWTRKVHFDVLHSHKDLYDRFKSTVLKPAFDSRRIFGKVIFVDYVRSGESVRNLQDVLQESGIWSDSIYLMRLMSKDDPRKRLNIPNFKNKPDIDLGDNEKRRLITNGGLPRTVPHYPLQWWDVDWEDAYNPDAALAPGIIRALQDNNPQVPPVPGHPTSTTNGVTSLRARRFQSEGIMARQDQTAATTTTEEDTDDVDGDETTGGLQDVLPWPVDPAQSCVAGGQASLPASTISSQPVATPIADEAATSRRMRKFKV